MEPAVDISKHQDLIYDVGLHKAEDAEFYLRKGFRVIAFEAEPKLIAFCRQRLKEFVDNGQLTIIEGAIVSPEGLDAGQKTVHFYTDPFNSSWGTVLSNWAERNARLRETRLRNMPNETSSSVIEVDAVDFPHAIRKHGVPYFMKIDIEGCDLVCLNALCGFKERPTYISIESDKTSFKNIEREIELLAELGYTSFKAVNQAKVHLSHSPQPPKEGKYVSHRFEHGSSGLFGSELEGKWRSKREILRQYRFIRLGYFLFGDDGVMFIKSKFRGARLVNALTRRVVDLLTRGSVPGWYDTHARQS
jgi:FkbM family methyltransferase